MLKIVNSIDSFAEEAFEGIPRTCVSDTFKPISEDLICFMDIDNHQCQQVCQRESLNGFMSKKTELAVCEDPCKLLPRQSNLQRDEHEECSSIVKNKPKGQAEGVIASVHELLSVNPSAEEGDTQYLHKVGNRQRQAKAINGSCEYQEKGTSGCQGATSENVTVNQQFLRRFDITKSPS